MDVPTVSSSSLRTIVQIPQAQEFFEEIKSAIGGTDEEKCETSSLSSEATEEKRSLNESENSLDLFERVDEIHARFLKEANAAFNNMASIKSSRVVVDVEETERIVAISSLLEEIAKFQNLTKRYDKPLNQLRKGLTVLKRKLLEVDPVLSLGPSESLRNWGTMTVSTKKKSHFPSFVIPLKPKEAFAELERHPLSDRCKMQILIKIFQENDRLLYLLNRFKKNVESKDSKAPPIGEIVEYFINVAHLFSSEDKELLRKTDSPKAILDVIHRRQKTLCDHLDDLQLGVEKRFSFRQLKAVYSFLHQMLKSEDEKEQKALAVLTRLLDPIGAVRTVIILEKGQSAARTVVSLGRLLNRLANKQPPATVVQAWHRVWMDERVHMGLNLDLRSLAKVHTRCQGQIKYEGASLAAELLMHYIDPTAMRVAVAFLDKKPSLQNYCEAYATAEMILFKMCWVLKLSEEKLGPYKTSLHTAFGIQIKGLRGKSSASPKKGEKIDFTEAILPLLKNGKLPRSQRTDLAQTLFHQSAIFFASLPAGMFYDDTWKKNSTYLTFTKEAERLMQFVFCNILKGENDKERAHIMGQFHLIALEALEIGEFFFSLYIAETPAKVWTKNLKGSLEIFHGNKGYKKAEAKIQDVFKRTKNYAATREEEARCQKSGCTIVPHLPLYTQELRFLSDAESNPFDTLSMGNQFVHMLFTMRYWLTMHEGKFSPGTTFLDEVSKHVILDRDTLYNLV